MTKPILSVIRIVTILTMYFVVDPLYGKLHRRKCKGKWQNVQFLVLFELSHTLFIINAFLDKCMSYVFEKLCI